MGLIQKKILELAKKSRPRISIAITNPKPELLESLKKSQEYADVVIVGKSVPGFECVETDQVEKTGFDLYKQGKVQGVIRGQGDAFIFRDCLCKEFGYELKNIMDVSLLVTKRGQEYFLGPVSQPQGWIKSQKIIAAKGTAEILKEFGVIPKIGFLTAVRPGSRGRNFFLDGSYEIADECVEWCQNNGLDAKNYNIELETALAEGCNVIVPPNGVAGNQMYRVSMFAAELPVLANPGIGIKEPFVENIRNETDMLNYFLYVAARINRKI